MTLLHWALSLEMKEKSKLRKQQIHNQQKKKGKENIPRRNGQYSTLISQSKSCIIWQSIEYFLSAQNNIPRYWIKGRN